MYVPLITIIYTHTLYCTCTYVYTLYIREREVHNVGRKERKRVASKERGQGRRDLKSK